MAHEPTPLEKLQVLANMEQLEVTTHWTRNNYFLVVSSLLLVALSQFKVQALQLLVGASGLSLTLIWLLMQDSSDRYIKHWNTQIHNLGEMAGFPPFYPTQGRKVPIRVLAYALPVPFLALWTGVIILAALGMITSASAALP